MVLPCDLQIMPQMSRKIIGRNLFGHFSFTSNISNSYKSLNHARIHDLPAFKKNFRVTEF